jgi:ATP-dependent RNA helicase SUPV3L1/SUV3
MLERAGSGLEALDKSQRSQLARLGVRVGALDLFVPQMVRPGPLAAWRELACLDGSASSPAPPPPCAMPPALSAGRGGPPAGYRRIGKQWVRLDIAEKLLREAHGLRVAAGKKFFALDPARAVSMGLTTASYANLLRLAGFAPKMPKKLAEGAYGPPAPLAWRWRPPRRREPPGKPRGQPSQGAFASLAELVS